MYWGNTNIDALREYKYRCIEGIQIWLMHSTIKHFQKNSNSDKLFRSYIYYYIVNMIWYICSCNDINYSSFKFSVVSFSLLWIICILWPVSLDCSLLITSSGFSITFILYDLFFQSKSQIFHWWNFLLILD